MKLRNLLAQLKETSFVKSLCTGATIWVVLYAHAAFQFALFSIPSTGWAKILIPAFFITGCVLSYSLYTHKDSWAVAGGLAFTACSIIRAIALVGVEQGGAGGNFLAASVWIWITILSICFTLEVYYRGMDSEEERDEGGCD